MAGKLRITRYDENGEVAFRDDNYTYSPGCNRYTGPQDMQDATGHAQPKPDELTANQVEEPEDYLDIPVALPVSFAVSRLVSVHPGVNDALYNYQRELGYINGAHKEDGTMRYERSKRNTSLVEELRVSYLQQVDASEIIFKAFGDGRIFADGERRLNKNAGKIKDHIRRLNKKFNEKARRDDEAMAFEIEAIIRTAVQMNEEEYLPDSIQELEQAATGIMKVDESTRGLVGLGAGSSFALVFADEYADYFRQRRERALDIVQSELLAKFNETYDETTLRRIRNRVPHVTLMHKGSRQAGNKAYEEPDTDRARFPTLVDFETVDKMTILTPSDSVT